MRLPAPDTTVEQRGDLFNPARHVYVSTGSENYNHILVHLGDLLNEAVLSSRQAKGAIASLTFRRGIKAHAENHHICFLGQSSSLFSQGARCGRNSEPGCGSADRFEIFQSNLVSLAALQMRE